MKKSAKKEKLDLLESASVLYELSKRVQGEPLLILSNALGHLMARYYENGYFIQNI